MIEGPPHAERSRGFTLVELLAVVACLAVLAALVLPAALRARDSGRRAVCAGNLRQMYAAYMMYLDDHQGAFFPWREKAPGGVLWYWGLEASGGGAEGKREIDRSKARLAPYLGQSTVETCPAFPYRSTAYKQKFATATYGYGLNSYMLVGTIELATAGIRRFTDVARPQEILVWGDAAQVNRFQTPASPGNPLLEEWYYLAAKPGGAELPTFHFRHNRLFSGVLGDGSVALLPPERLLPYCDGLVGYLEPPGQNHYLMTRR